MSSDDALYSIASTADAIISPAFGPVERQSDATSKPFKTLPYR